ncbi:MAG TPA: hypothetical protein VF713_21295, partial [Thermoanaerobaculia bacterium]
PPPRRKEHDRAIDSAYGLIEVCGQMEYASDILYALDPTRYRETALELYAGEPEPSDKDSTS